MPTLLKTNGLYTFWTYKDELLCVEDTSTQTSNLFVRNMKGSGTAECSYSFIGLYRKSLGIKTTLKCCISGCSRTDVDGAHVKFKSNPNLYLVPMCCKHNRSRSTKYFKCKKNIRSLFIARPSKKKIMVKWIFRF